MRIALLEEDPPLATRLERWLGDDGHVVRAFADDRALVREALHSPFDACVLEGSCAREPALEVLARLRRDGAFPGPILVITGRDAGKDVASLLTGGADDFLPRPVRRLELLARVNAMARRAGLLGGDAPFVSGPFRLDPLTSRATVNGRSAGLTHREFQLALLLFRHLGTLLTRRTIAEAVWGHGEQVFSRTMDTHASKLRRKLGLSPERGYRLVSVYGTGYRLEVLGVPAPAEAVAPRPEAPTPRSRA